MNLIEPDSYCNLSPFAPGTSVRLTETQERHMVPFKRGGVWWYKFYFAWQLIRESSKSTSKTVAKNAEQERRRELEAGFNNLKDVRQQRIRSLEDISAEYLVGYRLRYRSASFAEYALGHVSRLLGTKLVVDIDEAAVSAYQESRLRHGRIRKASAETHCARRRNSMTPGDKYPALMAYIADRSNKDEKTAWNVLRADEAAAIEGNHAEVAGELEKAQADYAAVQTAKGASG